MRFSGIILVLLVVVSLFASTAAEFTAVNRMRVTAMENNRQTDAQYFISESFRKTCRGECFESLNEWQTVCRDLWSLDYIGWGNAEDFMSVDYSLNESPLIYGKWQGRLLEGEVYCRRSAW